MGAEASGIAELRAAGFVVETNGDAVRITNQQGQLIAHCTLASLFSTGTVVSPTADLAANILRRGDTAIRRGAVSAAGATSS